jgi:hypothetical protein
MPIVERKNNRKVLRGGLKNGDRAIEVDIGKKLAGKNWGGIWIMAMRWVNGFGAQALKFEALRPMACPGWGEIRGVRNWVRPGLDVGITAAYLTRV